MSSFPPAATVTGRPRPALRPPQYPSNWSPHLRSCPLPRPFSTAANHFKKCESDHISPVYKPSTASHGIWNKISTSYHGLQGLWAPAPLTTSPAWAGLPLASLPHLALLFPHGPCFSSSAKGFACVVPSACVVGRGAPRDVHAPIPITCDMFSCTAKGTSQVSLTLQSLQQGERPLSSRWVQFNHMSLL